MKTHLKVVALWVISCGVCLACPVLSESDQIAEAAKDREELRAAVSEIFASADSVFIGRVVDVATEAFEAPVDGKLVDFERYWISFDVLRRLKGPNRPERLSYVKQLNTLSVGCSPMVGFYEPDLHDHKGFRFLVYAKDGVILRENIVVDWFEMLSVKEELDMVRESGHLIQQ